MDDRENGRKLDSWKRYAFGVQPVAFALLLAQATSGKI